MFTFDDYRKYPGAAAPGVGTDLATFSFPAFDGAHPSLPAFLTTTSGAPLIGDLTGRTVSASFGVLVTGAPVFIYGGQGLTWNNCPGSPPASVRLFFSTRANAYTLSQSNNNPANYWWSNPVRVDLDSQGQNSLLAVSLASGSWEDAGGHFSTDPLYAALFAAACRNVEQIGLSFSGGCFFDVGVALVTGSGTATFHLLDFEAN